MPREYLTSRDLNGGPSGRGILTTVGVVAGGVAAFIEWCWWSAVIVVGCFLAGLLIVAIIRALFTYGSQSRR